MTENNENIEEMKAETLNDEQPTNNTEEPTSADNASAEEATPTEEPELTLEEQLALANAKIEQLQKDALYKVAEFDNFRKRQMKEKAELIKNGGANVMKALLPIIDDFERADQMMDKMEDIAAVKEGLKLIIEKFMKQLATEGLQKIDCVGKDFDTDYHEAIAMVPGQPAEMQNKVMDCIQTGYMMGDKVLRHAKVAVANDPS